MKYVKMALLLLLTIVIIGCEEDDGPKSTFYHKVYRQNHDGRYTVWDVHKPITFANGFVYWTLDNGKEFWISGNISVVPVEVRPDGTVREGEMEKSDSVGE